MLHSAHSNEAGHHFWRHPTTYSFFNKTIFLSIFSVVEMKFLWPCGLHPSGQDVDVRCDFSSFPSMSGHVGAWQACLLLTCFVFWGLWLFLLFSFLLSSIMFGSRFLFQRICLCRSWLHYKTINSRIRPRILIPCSSMFVCQFCLLRRSLNLVWNEVTKKVDSWFHLERISNEGHFRCLGNEFQVIDMSRFSLPSDSLEELLLRFDLIRIFGLFGEESIISV